MLAYAANRRTRRKLSPTALTLIIGGHAIALGLLITAKMDVTVFPRTTTKIFDVPLPKPPEDPTPPPPRQIEQQPQVQPPISRIDTVPPVIPLPIDTPLTPIGPPVTEIVPDVGKIIDTPLPQPIFNDQLPKAPVKVAARLVTPSDLLRPPYPDAKRRSDEEAVLRLRLTVDPRGRVTAVEPVGAVDPDFLAAARAHVLRHWRYRPATEDGRAVSTTLTVTLRFELED